MRLGDCASVGERREGEQEGVWVEGVGVCEVCAGGQGHEGVGGGGAFGVVGRCVVEVDGRGARVEECGGACAGGGAQEGGEEEEDDGEEWHAWGWRRWGRNLWFVGAGIELC